MLDSLFIANAASRMAADNKAATAGEMASRLSKQVRTENEEIKYDVEKLFMITQALWEIVKHHHGYTDDQLEAMIKEIDLRDGVLNGKLDIKEGPQKCSGCGRSIIARQQRCLYCGEETKTKSLRG